VRLAGNEPVQIASFLGIKEVNFTEKYAELDPSRRFLRLRDHDGGTECVFLSPTGECVIHPVKPAQCRTFPMNWNYDGYEDLCAAKKKERNR
jgi:uncharacterized protein